MSRVWIGATLHRQPGDAVTAVLATRVTVSGHPLELICWLVVLVMAILYIVARRTR